MQRVALCVQEYKSKYTESVNAFLEEAIVRSELADNFCFYCEHYDSVKGASNWAQKTLDDHRLGLVTTEDSCHLAKRFCSCNFIFLLRTYLILVRYHIVRLSRYLEAAD